MHAQLQVDAIWNSQTCNLKEEVRELALYASRRRDPSEGKKIQHIGSSARRSLAGRTGDGAERPAKADRDQMIKSRGPG